MLSAFDKTCARTAERRPSAPVRARQNFHGKYASRGGAKDSESWRHALDALIHPAATTYKFNVALNSLLRAEQVDKASAIIDIMMKEQVEADTITCNGFIGVSGQDGGWRAAMSALYGIMCYSVEPSIVSINTALRACDGKGGGTWQMSVHLLQGASAAGLERSIVSWCTSGSATSTARQWPRGMALMAELRMRALQQNVVCLSVAASFSETDESWQYAISSLAASTGLRPNTGQS
eukprot:TRINITY_DN18185_c0_g1_i1.p1 TRINITY_DN18185_c0_g1~~TRINITY_DN18185_c0_g1_i1.p1  ORF type:complete len:236 (+),score=33.79 TRINITY_DN18185_c0_g1_i1:323-1030(+)